jgi:hypothetical protein
MPPCARQSWFFRFHPFERQSQRFASGRVRNNITVLPGYIDKARRGIVND